MDFLLNTASEWNTLREPGDPFAIAFHMGTYGVHWYSITFLLGFFFAVVIASYKLKMYYKVSYDPTFYYIIFCIPVSILGARVWSCFIGDALWASFFNFGTGGLAIQGGVIAALILGAIFFPLILRNPKYHVRVQKDGEVHICQPSIWVYADAMAMMILFGQAIGRWGNFMNGEVFGQMIAGSATGNDISAIATHGPNDLGWLHVMMPNVYNHMMYTGSSGFATTNHGATESSFAMIQGAYYQPLFLYESFLNVVLWIVIYWTLSLCKDVKLGVMTFAYFIIYGIVRTTMESMRAAPFQFESTFVLNGMLLAIGIIGVGLTQWFFPNNRNFKVWYFIYANIHYYVIKIQSIITRIKVKNPEKKYYGFNKIPTFERELGDKIYYFER